MYQQQKKTPFCALTMYLRSTGNQSPKYEYKADAKSLFTCSLTKKKYKLSQIDEWYHTEGVQNFVRQGYSGKWFAKTQEIENPNKYDKSNLQMILSFIMILFVPDILEIRPVTTLLELLFKLMNIRFLLLLRVNLLLILPINVIL